MSNSQLENISTKEELLGALEKNRKKHQKYKSILIKSLVIALIIGGVLQLFGEIFIILEFFVFMFGLIIFFKFNKIFEPEKLISKYTLEELKNNFSTYKKHIDSEAEFPISSLVDQPEHSSYSNSFQSYAIFNDEPIIMGTTDVTKVLGTGDSRSTHRYSVLHFSIPLEKNRFSLSINGKKPFGADRFDPIGKLDDKMDIYTNDNVTSQRILSPAAIAFIESTESDLSEKFDKAAESVKLVKYLFNKTAFFRILIDRTGIHVFFHEPFSSVEGEALANYGESIVATKEILENLDKEISKRIKTIENTLIFAFKLKDEIEYGKDVMGEVK